MVEPVHTSRVQQEKVRADLAKLEMEELLRYGDINQIKTNLPKGVSPADFEKFMNDQWRSWRGVILQENAPYHQMATVPDPVLQNFPVHNEGTALDSHELTEFTKGMTTALYSKAAPTGKSEQGKQLGSQDLDNLAQGTLDDWDSFMNDMSTKILDMQMVQDYQQKMGEVQREVQRIIAMAKMGQIDPEFVLIALAKVNQTKNGVLMTWLGKKAFVTNENMNKISEELRKAPADQYFSALQTAQAKTRDGSFQLQLLTMDIQKVANDTASVLEQVKSMIEEITRTKRQLAMNISAR